MKFAVTFGQKYRREDHPTFLPAHPDGYVVIDVTYGPPLPSLASAVEYDQARDAAFELLGSQWSMLYEMDSDAWRADAAEYYTRGQIGLIERQHGHWVFVEPHTAYGPMLYDGTEPGSPCWCKIRHSHATDDPEPQS